MKAAAPRVLEFGEFRLDLEEHSLRRGDGTEVPLTPRVFATLTYLIEHAGSIVEKKAILEAVWSDCVVEENNLAQAISKLRQVLGDKNGAQQIIVTVPGRGYRFVAEVRSAEEVVSPLAPAEIEDTGAPAERRWRGPFVVSCVALLLVTLLAVVWWRWTEPAPPAPAESVVPAKSIAVLPFENLSDDKQNAYFAEGIKDEILTRLSKIAALKVISRTSTQKFKDGPHNIRQIAQELGVAHLLEGSVQKSGQTVRVTVQLIQADSDTHLWGETYDRQLTDMFAVETEIAQRIARSLEATLSGAETHALNLPPTANVEAYQEFLKGRFFWNKRTVEGFHRAVEHLTRAIELDPAYAQAHAGLADAILFLQADDPRGPEDRLNRGRAELARALELNDSLAEAHATLGLLAMNVDWDWAQAEQEFKRAIALDPNYATAHHWYGEFLAYMGRSAEAIREIKRAQELDPLSLIIATDVAKVYALSRRYEEAIVQFKRALEMDPQFAEAHAVLGLTYTFTGQHDAAIAELRAIKNIENHQAFLAWLGYACGLAGKHDEAEAVYRRLTELSQQTYVSPLWMVLIHIGRNDPDEAFKWYERVFAERASGGAVVLKANPVLDPLRSDPRFRDLLVRAGFEH
jgi:TolB-like protein/DNA-binding winged helix-turn-helix (wHTH) protein/Tfp pilus assembly protein PilF